MQLFYKTEIYGTVYFGAVSQNSRLLSDLQVHLHGKLLQVLKLTVPTCNFTQQYINILHFPSEPKKQPQ